METQKKSAYKLCTGRRWEYYRKTSWGEGMQTLMHGSTLKPGYLITRNKSYNSDDNIAVVLPLLGASTPDEHEANAVLISLAPEMAALLIEASGLAQMEQAEQADLIGRVKNIVDRMSF